MGISRSPTNMLPYGSMRKVRHQLRGFILHDRTNIRPSTTTAQMPMTRCGSLPARMPSILSLRMVSRTSSEKRFFSFIYSCRSLLLFILQFDEQQIQRAHRYLQLTQGDQHRNDHQDQRNSKTPLST